MSIKSISVEELGRITQSGRPVRLLDVRTAVEFATVHAVGARNLPLHRVSAASVGKLLGEDSTGPLYVICKSGGRSQVACRMLDNAGMKQVVNVEGGTNAWIHTGQPVVRGAAILPVLAFARLAAGALAIINAFMSFTPNRSSSTVTTCVVSAVIFVILSVVINRLGSKNEGGK